MTTVRYYNDARSFSISFRGHAGYAEGGKDIVCAGISVLASELILACDNALEKGEIEHLSYRAESGNVQVKFEYVSGGVMREITALVLQCLQSVAQQYTPYLSVVKMSDKSNV